MKKTTIVGLFAIAICMVVLAAMMVNFSNSATFGEASEQEGKVFRLTGQLVKEKPIDFDPRKPNTFSFYMTDKDNVERQVICNTEMPTEFKRSEELVLTGKMQDNTFIAHKILTKCPSKYEESEIQEKASA